MNIAILWVDVVKLSRSNFRLRWVRWLNVRPSGTSTQFCLSVMALQFFNLWHVTQPIAYLHRPREQLWWLWCGLAVADRTGPTSYNHHLLVQWIETSSASKHLSPARLCLPLSSLLASVALRIANQNNNKLRPVEPATDPITNLT